MKRDWEFNNDQKSQLLEPTVVALNKRNLLEYYVVFSDHVGLESLSGGCLARNSDYHCATKLGQRGGHCQLWKDTQILKFIP